MPPSSYKDRYKALLNLDTTNHEKFARDALGLLEADLRLLALLSLQEWANTGITSKDLFSIIGSLQKPSWGVWNALLIQLRKLHRHTLATADQVTRERIEQTNINALLELGNENCKSKQTTPWLQPLFKCFAPKGGKLPRTISLQKLLAAPIGLRNRIAHDAPRANDFWQTTAICLRPLIEWLDSHTDLSTRYTSYKRQSPWFIEQQHEMLRDSKGGEFKQRFKQEATILSRFHRADIVSVVAYGEDIWQRPRNVNLDDQSWYKNYFKNGRAKKTYMALEWIDGKTLSDYFQSDEAPSYQQLTHWFISATEALQRVHEDGYIHRDVTPNNIMIRVDGQLKLMDFGIARSNAENRTLMTSADTQLGTYVYMSPEQLLLKQATTHVSFSSDIYGLTATFYELYTQKRLYGDDKEGKHLPEQTIITKKQQGERPLAPKKIIKSIAWELDTILRGGLENDPKDRYKSMTLLKQDLQHYLKDEPIEYQRPSLYRRTQLAYRRNRPVVNSVALSLLVLVSFTTWYLINLQVERDRAEASAIAEREARIAEEKALAAEYKSAIEERKARKAAEAARNEAEQSAQAEKKARKEAEASAITAEKARKAAETARKKAEKSAIAEEKARKVAEKSAIAEEKARKAAEKSAIAEEKARKAAEKSALAEERARKAEEAARKVAEKNAAEERKARKKAEDLIQFMISDLRDKLTAVGRPDLMEPVEKRVNAHFLDTPTKKNNPSTLRRKAIAKKQRADTLAMQGNNQQAMKIYQEAHRMYLALAKNNPKKALWQNDLAISYINLGKMHKRRGEHSKAINANQEALWIRTALTRRQPNNRQWRKNEAASYERLADLYKAQGRTEDAEQAYSQALELLEK